MKLSLRRFHSLLLSRSLCSLSLAPSISLSQLLYQGFSLYTQKELGDQLYEELGDELYEELGDQLYDELPPSLSRDAFPSGS